MDSECAMEPLLVCGALCPGGRGHKGEKLSL